jgi:hypothetical protein
MAALAGFCTASLVLAFAGTGSMAWLAGGACVMALGGLATGTWVVSRHGERFTQFLAAAVAGVLLRMLLVLAGAMPLALSGPAAFWSYVLGLAAVFLPMQLHEIRVLRGRGVAA